MEKTKLEKRQLGIINLCLHLQIQRDREFLKSILEGDNSESSKKHWKKCQRAAISEMLQIQKVIKKMMKGKN